MDVIRVCDNHISCLRAPKLVMPCWIAFGKPLAKPQAARFSFLPLRTGGMICSFFPLVFVRVLMGIVSRAAVVAPDRERERGRERMGRGRRMLAPLTGRRLRTATGGRRVRNERRKEGRRQLRWGFSSSRGEAGMLEAPRRPRHLQNPGKMQ